MDVVTCRTSTGGGSGWVGVGGGVSVGVRWAHADGTMQEAAWRERVLGAAAALQARGQR